MPYFAGLSLAVLILARYEPTPLHTLMSLLPGFERIHARSPERALIVFYVGPALLAAAALTCLQTKARLSFRVPLAVLALAVVGAELQLAWNAQRAESLAGGGDYQFEQVDLSAYYAPGGAARFLASSARSDRFRYFGYAQHIFGGPVPYTLRWADSSITALEVNNRALLSGLDDIQGYNPIHVARYDEYMAALNGHAQNYHQTDVFDSGLDSPLLDLLNVRYIVLPARLPQDQVAPSFRRSLETVYQDQDVRVLQIPTALPRAWLVHAAEQLPPDQALQQLADGIVDPRHVALLEAPPPSLAQPQAGAVDEVSIVSYEPDRIRLTTRSSTAGLVVLSEVYYPAWQARLDDQAVPLYVADHVLRAVAVPAGEHTVELGYQSLALNVGLVISAAAGVVLAWLYTGPHNYIARRVGGSPVQGRRCPATVSRSASRDRQARMPAVAGTARLRARGAGPDALHEERSLQRPEEVFAVPAESVASWLRSCPRRSWRSRAWPASKRDAVSAQRSPTTLASRTTFAAPPQRIVSLNPGLTEITFALGAGNRLVAVDTYSDYPPEAKNVQPRLTTYPSPSTETIVGLKPDLVLCSGRARRGSGAASGARASRC